MMIKIPIAILFFCFVYGCYTKVDIKVNADMLQREKIAGVWYKYGTSRNYPEIYYLGFRSTGKYYFARQSTLGTNYDKLFDIKSDTLFLFIEPEDTAFVTYIFHVRNDSLYITFLDKPMAPDNYIFRNLIPGKWKLKKKSIF